MHQYNVHFRWKNHEFCGGKNKSNSKNYLLWINERKGEEFKYSIGSENEKTGVITLTQPVQYPKELQIGVDRLLKLITKL